MGLGSRSGTESGTYVGHSVPPQERSGGEHYEVMVRRTTATTPPAR